MHLDRTTNSTMSVIVKLHKRQRKPLQRITTFVSRTPFRYDSSNVAKHFGLTASHGHRADRFYKKLDVNLIIEFV